ncbi:MAG TPA: VCBS repeat-containing protein, partial [Verrucomicrobiae bacterium]|nr:VCBS repeat-containing protein [Verrucomicrobiae bacterium]
MLLTLTAFAQLTNTNTPVLDVAHLYCQSCHLFPEPALLDKQSWVKGALRRMAPLLGAAKLDFERRPDGKILKEAGLFPSGPLISEHDWREIIRYYQENAPTDPAPQKTQTKIEFDLKRFKPQPLRYPGATHLTSLVRIDPGKSRIFVGNAAARSLDVVSLEGKLLSRTQLESAPVDLAVRPEGLFVTLIGDLFPSDERKGKLVLLTETNGVAEVRTILDQLSRPTSSTFADLNNDGRDDLVLCSFGNYLGRFSWYERTPAGLFSEHVLLEQSGAVNSVLYAGPKTARPDIYVLTAQGREGIHRFRYSENQFIHETIAEFHPAFGSSHLELVDFDRDGFPDLLVTNGDNGDYPSRLKNYHGVRLYMNDGAGHFHERWFYPLNGAFKALAADFDGDGDLDIA